MYGTLRRKVKECFILADIGKHLIAPSLKDHLAKLMAKRRELEVWTDGEVNRMIDYNRNPRRALPFQFFVRYHQVIS